MSFQFTKQAMKRADCSACAYGVEQAAGLAELQAVSGQFRLQAALFAQQVRHQDANQVGAAGTGQHLHLHTHTNGCYGAIM